MCGAGKTMPATCLRRDKKDMGYDLHEAPRGAELLQPHMWDWELLCRNVVSHITPLPST